MIAYLYWPLTCLLMAWAQGWLLPAIKRTPPGAEATRQSMALHVLLTGVYFLPLVQLITYNSQLIAYNCIAAVLARLLLFDVAINLASGSPAFAVGSTAATDKALRWLAARVSCAVERVRFVCWVISIIIVLVLGCWYAVQTQ